MQRVKHWLLAFRPKTLTAAVVPIFTTTALVYWLGYPVQWQISILALLASLFIQIGTNLINDASDFKKGADREDRLGPTRVTQAGLIEATAVTKVAWVFFALALLCGIPLVIAGGFPILVIGIFSILFGAAYTSGPYPLAYHGWGDFFVVLFFGVIASMGLFYLHTGVWSIDAFILGIQVGFLCAVLIAVNNLRDVESDRRANKKTLPVRFGVRFARYEIGILSFVPFIMQLYWLAKGNWLAFLLGFFALPLAIKGYRMILQNEPSAIYNEILAKAAGTHLLFGLLLSVGLFL